VNGLLLRLLDHGEPTVRLAVLQRFATMPVPDSKRKLLAATLAKLQSPLPDERTTALHAALRAAVEADAPAFTTAFQALLPQREFLTDAVIAFIQNTRNSGDSLRRVRALVLATVEADTAATGLAVRLAESQLAAKPFAQWVAKLATTNRWHTATHRVLEQVLGEKQRPSNELKVLETHWAAANEPTLRWLALRVLQQTATQHGWTATRRARLAKFQHDSHPLVADEAAFVFPPPE
jgi:hypothetical protein